MSLVQEWLPALSEEDLTTIGRKLQELGVKCAEHFRYLQESDLNFLAPVQRRILLEKFQTRAAPVPSGPSGTCATVTSDANSQLDEWAEKFCIPWEIFPPRLLQACKAQERATKADLNQMVRMLSSLILDKHSAPGRRNLRIIAAKLVSVYPSTFQDLLEGTVVGTGVETLMWKLENCINNKKRPIAHKLPVEIDDPDSFQPRPRSRRDSYGCLAWQPELPSGENMLAQREKQQQLLCEHAKMYPNKQLVCRLMIETYASQRLTINHSRSVTEVKKNWPFLFTEDCLLQHSKELLGSEVCQRLDASMEIVGLRVYRYAYSQIKRPKVKKCLEEIEQAKNRLKSVTPEHEGAPVLLLALLDEDEELIYKTVEETAHDDDLGDMPLTPIICMKGPGLFEAEMFTVCVDGVALLTTQRAAAFKAMFLLYFVLNIEYPPEVALTLEFVQRAIARINPERSTKARRTSKKQYCLSPKVAALANALDQYKF
ncbi:uncharacterized protein LOC119393762 [Rhipicephalus sanguineus]|uniref:uncharacterized protein LOC119393762 n=1 Tax=Rhipicephalus sanguineus TaxID=34632 RepID=UPI0020C36FB3|nr:uncharacterized protein LOC119393762 [Rhipicephalus sanguineus]